MLWSVQLGRCKGEINLSQTLNASSLIASAGSACRSTTSSRTERFTVTATPPSIASSSMATCRALALKTGVLGLFVIVGLVKSMKIVDPSSSQTGGPKIDIEDWLQAGEIEWQATSDGLFLDPDMLTVDGDLYFISEYVTGLVISCQASYPIEWHSDVGEVRFTLRYKIVMKNEADLWCFKGVIPTKTDVDTGESCSGVFECL